MMGVAGLVCNLQYVGRYRTEATDREACEGQNEIKFHTHKVCGSAE